MQQNRKELYISGFPKSGNTWVARLLGDALDSPVMARKPKMSIGDEGFDREGKYVIRQEHLSTDKYKGEKPVILVVRDPRDVAVSAWKYWRRPSLLRTIHDMGTGRWPIPHGGGWSSFYEFWLNDAEPDVVVKYEELLEDTYTVLQSILSKIDIEPVFDLKEVIHRQSFEERKNIAKNNGDLLPYGKAVQIGFLRRGISGDWKNHFDQKCKKQAYYYFHETAEKYGYYMIM